MGKRKDSEGSGRSREPDEGGEDFLSGSRLLHPGHRECPEPRLRRVTWMLANGSKGSGRPGKAYHGARRATARRELVLANTSFAPRRESRLSRQPRIADDRRVIP